MTDARARPGRRRHADRPGARPDRPRLHPPRRSASTSTSRASSTGTSARPISRRQVDMEQLRSPARLRDDAAALRARLAGRGGRTRPPRLARRSSWSRSRRRRRRSPATPLPYLEHVTRCFAYTPPRIPDDRFEAAAADDRRPAPGRRPARRPAGRLGRPVRDRRRSPARGRRLAGRALPGDGGRRVRPAGRRGPAGLARHATSRGAPTTGSTAAVARGSTSTPTCRSARTDLTGLVAHEAYPGHHLEHAWKEAELVDRAGRLESSILLINTPECLISEGLADLASGSPLRPPDGSTSWSRSSSAPACRSPPIRPRPREAATARRRAREPPPRRSARSAATPRSCATPTGARTTRSSRT